jgi:DNA-binding IscR family transcriptional regulator
MLQELLQIVAEGGVHSYENLAQRLSISQPLLEAMLEDLGRLGYLRSMGDGCGGKCQACPAGSCSVSSPGHLWTLTEQGVRAASRL